MCAFLVFAPARLDHVRIDRALREPLAPPFGELGRFALEHVDEQAADDLALLLGVGDAGERRQELVAGIDVDRRARRGCARTCRITCVGLVLAQQAVVDEHAGQPVADRAWISAAATDESTPPDRPRMHLVAADLRADRGDRLVDVVGHVPVAAAAADVVHEAREDRLALLRVRDLGMELHGVEAARLVGHRRDRARVAARRSA